MRLFHDLVEVSHHITSLADPARGWSQWTNDYLFDGIGLFPGGLSIVAKAALGRVPLTIDVVRERPPGIERGAKEHPRYTSVRQAAVELGAALAIPVPGRPIVVAVEPGRYGAMLYAGNEDSVTYDDDTGSEFYHLVLWPTDEAVATALLHAIPCPERATRTPRLPPDDARRLWFSDDVHDRLAAAVDLVRHGSPLVLTMREDDPVTLHHTIAAALALGPEDPLLERGIAERLRPDIRAFAAQKRQRYGRPSA